MEFDSSVIAKFCQKHHITRMLSYNHPSRTAAEKERVLDFLVDFEPGHSPGYFDMTGGPGLIGMEEELAELLGKEQVYLDGPGGDNLLFPSKSLDEAIAMAEPFYQA